MIFKKNKHIHSYGKVTLEEPGFIRLEVAGHSSAKIVEGPNGTTIKVNKYIKYLKSEHKTVSMLMNVKKVVSTDSVARNHVMTLGKRGVERIAVVGVNRFIRSLVPYFLRVLNKTTEIKFFSNEEDAIKWLTTEKELILETQDKQSYTFPIYASIALALVVLAGWMVDRKELTAFIAMAPSMNPFAAILLGTLSASLFVYHIILKKQSTEWIVGVPAILVIVSSIAVLARYVVGFDTHIDQLLFTGHVEIYQDSARIKVGTAIGMLIIGLLTINPLVSIKNKWTNLLFYPLLYGLQLALVLAIVSYGLGVFDENTRSFIAFADAVDLILITYSLYFIGPKFPITTRILKATQREWAAISVGIIFFGVTCVGWQYTNSRVREYSQLKTEAQFRTIQTNLDSRLTEYVESLHSIRGFFYASDTVSVSEFKDYIDNSHIIKNNPGLSSIAFITYLTPEKVSAHEKHIRSLASSEYPEYKAYKVFPLDSANHIYSLTYSEPKNINGVFGYNLASSQKRNTALTAALKSGKVQASGTIDLNESQYRNNNTLLGSFFTVPLYRHSSTQGDPKTQLEREERIYGFINIYFRQDIMFKEIFSRLPREIMKDDQINVIVRDSTTNEVVYTKQKDFTALEQYTGDANTILRGKSEVAGSKWDVSVIAQPAYGVPEGAKELPLVILITGLVLTAIATVTVLGLSRRREQAVELARQMTEDLSEERNAAVENQKKEEAILSSIGDAVFAIDTDQKIVVFNPTTEQLSGYTADEAIGQFYRNVLHFLYEGTETENVDFIGEALRGNEASMNDQTVLLTKDGKQIPVADSAAPILDGDGNISGAIVVFRDVTEERALERSKDEFVSVASHQLRTPLSAMNWYTEMLLNGDAGKLTPDQENYLKEIYMSNKRMTELVGSLLDTSRLDLGKLDSKPDHVDIRNLITSLKLEMNPMISSKQMTFKEVITTKHKNICTDPRLIRMVIQNLLSNALKYTPKEGTVTLKVEDVPHKDHKAHVEITVQDNGYGIPAAQQSKIFSKMFRADNVLEMEGTGLGMYIVREATHKMGGEVTFTSEENVGTTFKVRIPVGYNKAKHTSDHRGDMHEK